MIYPFEQTKDYKRSFLRVKDKEDYDILSHLVNSYDEVGVNNWFKEKNDYLKIKGKENLAKAIGCGTYYFSSQAPLGMKRKDIEDLETSKYLILLNHFKLEDQFVILTQNFKLDSEKIFELLFKTAKKNNKEQVFYGSRIIAQSLITLFNKEDFIKLQLIENIINKNIIDIETNHVAFLRNNGGSYYTLQNKYNITEEIMFNYTDNKKDFIQSYGREIPLKEKVYQLLEDINHKYKKNDYLTQGDLNTLKEVTQHLDNYIKTALYFELNKKLPEKNQLIKQLKI